MSCVLLGIALPWVGRCERAHAQDPGSDLELIESTERDEDPLGIDQSTGRELERAAAALPKPRALLPGAEPGAGLSAIAGVREARHTLRVELDHGLARVEAQIALASSARHSAEVSYRLPLPADGVLTELQLCQAQRCADALRTDASLEARTIADAQGRALALRVAPLAAGAALELRVRYVASAPVRGGVSRFAVPARGYDPRLAPTELLVVSSTLAQPTPSQTLDPWAPIAIEGTLRKRDSKDEACGPGCARRYTSLPFEAGPTQPTYVFIDSSPSMEGPARSRLPLALAALLAVLPEQGELRAFAFASSASELGRFRVGEAPLAALSDGASLDLGAASKPSAFARLVQGTPRVVVLSDGIFDVAPAERQALAALRKRGAETWLVELGDTPSPLRAAFSEVLDVAREAEATLHGGEPRVLEEALRALAAVQRQGLRAGEQRVVERARPGEPRVGEHEQTEVLRAGERGRADEGRADALARWIARAPLSIERRREVGAIAAPAYEPAPVRPPDAPTGMPKESVLSMLRTQLVPQARACLRSDRRGRADYAVALTFHALFAEREVYEAQITGSIPGALRQCLEALLPKLRVPAFTGRIRVHYPIFTERELSTPAIELEPALSQKLERAFGGSHALP